MRALAWISLMLIAVAAVAAGITTERNPVRTHPHAAPAAVVQRGVALPGSMLLPLVVLSLAVVVLGLWPSLMNWLTVPASRALLASMGY
jgi:formate hydrogenlyase subunit 3/multisubunit Na+/H+ antiporter MnhD subunit